MAHALSSMRIGCGEYLWWSLMYISTYLAVEEALYWHSLAERGRTLPWEWSHRMCLLYLFDINIETCQTTGILLPVRFTARLYFNMHRLEKPDALRWMHFHSQNLLQVVIQSRTHLTLLLCWLRMTQVLRTQHFDRPHFWPEVFDVVLKAVVCSRHPAIGSLALDPWNCWLVKVNGIEMMTHAVENTSVWYG